MVSNQPGDLNAAAEADVGDIELGGGVTPDPSNSEIAKSGRKLARLATPDRANRRSRSASDDTTSEPSTPTGDASRPSFLSNVLGVGLSEGDVVVVVKEEMGEDGKGKGGRCVCVE